jgi:DNA invertase Pin-like site-specific DNA recombinase
MGRAMLTVMSAFAQLERDQLAERTKAGWPRRRNTGGRLVDEKSPPPTRRSSAPTT